MSQLCKNSHLARTIWRLLSDIQVGVAIIAARAVLGVAPVAENAPMAGVASVAAAVVARHGRWNGNGWETGSQIW